MSYFPNKLILNVLACGLLLSCPLDVRLLADSSTDTTESSSANVGSNEVWKSFTSTESGFSVDLPTAPEHVSQTIDLPKSDLKIAYDTYISEPNDSVVYVISVWNYPASIDMSKPESNLQDGFGGMLSALPGSEVQTMTMSDVGGFPALEFLVKNDDIFFQGKLILVYNTLYQVFTVYKSKVDMSNDYMKFMDSFKLISPEKHKVTPPASSGSTPAATKALNV